MTTGCVRSAPDTSEHRLTAQESSHYQLPESLSDRKPGMEGEGKDGLEEVLGPEEQEEDQLKKPRRKDTPVLNSPPHIPGVRLMKGEKQMIHLEDEEKDGKD
ncbi:protein phosphatase 1 regulatory subunit 17 [Polymixia lowei]